ncbi:hypothetical protein Airi02_057710 [Actinoallomurus iriomotensis]|uniref:Uncharacterized protein n=1 Tax=Actinoallomurus iriomotensis TaxID=478107 RepID=A0A9W6S8Q5_9ACTN|nr:hypothetical protein Airi02_057710 [Actinoallomurus iriomotensis]
MPTASAVMPATAAPPMAVAIRVRILMETPWSFHGAPGRHVPFRSADPARESHLIALRLCRGAGRARFPQVDI